MVPGTVGWSSVLRHQCLIANSRIQGDCDTIQAHSPTDQPDNKSNDHIFKRVNLVETVEWHRNGERGHEP